MKVDELFGDRNDALSLKNVESKYFVRVTPGDMELVRLDPIYTDDGMIIPGYVNLIIDGIDESNFMERSFAEAFVGCRNHIPLPELMNHKHLIRH